MSLGYVTSSQLIVNSSRRTVTFRFLDLLWSTVPNARECLALQVSFRKTSTSGPSVDPRWNKSQIYPPHDRVASLFITTKVKCLLFESEGLRSNKTGFSVSLLLDPDLKIRSEM